MTDTRIIDTQLHIRSEGEEKWAWLLLAVQAREAEKGISMITSDRFAIL